MNTYSRILFVCTGNTCRSPMCATIMQHFLQGMNIRVESRGMVVLFPEPYNPKAVAVAARHGMIMPSDSTAQLSNDDFDNNTLVLVMNSAMKQKIYETYDRAINVYTLSEFAGEGELEVADPYAKGIDEYNRCFEQLYVLVEKSAETIRKNMEEKENDNSNRL
ncbi:MAG: protein tyrosine phosphatase [Lachnospira sp.]|nr:protein tyrosine phosphatase [Lachnospira sp.]